MLTPGNKKLGGRRIWGFSLPSGRPEICTGMSAQCHEHCYARQMERLRPAVLARYEKNLQLSQLSDFEQRVRYFILNHEIAVVRLHVGGEFYSPVYARKWLRIMRRLPDVRFFVYSRAWRDDHIRAALERMTQLPNCCLWYSCDKGTGVPGSVTPRVRLAWLMTDANDRPAGGRQPHLPHPAPAPTVPNTCRWRSCLSRRGWLAEGLPHHLRLLRSMLATSARGALANSPATARAIIALPGELHSDQSIHDSP